MGYMAGPPPRNKNKNIDSTQNYVDRVRVPSDRNYDFGGPGRGSGWRQRSLSNIDLTTQSKHSFTKQTRGYTSGLYDLYSRLETRKENENVYTNVNATEKVESIYDRIEQTLDTIKNTSESCSLRRTRSLAVIREETFNDLQIGGSRTRRSQLIPRAKLLDRGFFQNRTKKKHHRDEGHCNGLESQVSEARESDDYYSNLKNINVPTTAGGVLLPALWNNDKSDLDSLDSDYFKNSLHQLDGKKEQIVAKSNEVIEERTHDIQVQHIYIGENQTGAGNKDNIPDYCTVRYETNHSEELAQSKSDISCSNNPTETRVQVSNGDLSGCCGTLTNPRSLDEVTDTEEETLGRKSKFKEDHKSVISYDSIYLSSEGSGEATVIEEEKIHEYLSDNNYSTVSEYAQFRKKEIQSETLTNGNDKENGSQEQETNDILYSKINKHKPKIVLLEPKVPILRLTSFSDVTTRGTLERLTFVSSPASKRKEGEEKPKPTIRHISTVAQTIVPGDNQYCSLPVANIGQSLQASERIDAKLRLSCVDEEDKIYNSITQFGRTHKRTRQRESFEIVVLNPISIDEQPKEAPCINLIPNSKEKRVEVTKRSNQAKDNLVTIEPITAKRERKSNHSIAAVRESKEKKGEENKLRKPEEKPKRTSKLSQIELSLIDSTDNIIEETIDIPAKKLNDNQAVIRRNQRKRQIKSVERLSEHRDRASGHFKAALSNTLKRRLENKAKHNANEKPILRFARNIDKSKHNKHNKVHQAFLETFTSTSKPRINMSRPQILNVIDSKRTTAFRSPIKSNASRDGHKPYNGNIYGTKERTHKEFQEKVDSVRTYWSKLIDEQEEEAKEHYATDEYAQPQEDEIEIAPPTIPVHDAESSFKKARMKPSPPTPPPIPSPAILKPVGQNPLKTNIGPLSPEGNPPKEMLRRALINGKSANVKPSVEIVELDDKKQAALVKVQGTDTQDFDHVRYKVVKSDTFQKNILTQSKKEAQFDGLLQYLQDYSFQELLTKNNVVIIEPIRTKIEKTSSKANDSQVMACKITGGAGKLADGKHALKRHFFYHPVRVNKELLDEELPSPDTVRKAKQLFEEMLLFRSMKNGDRSTSIISINDNCKGLDKKFLQFESSYNNNGINGGIGGGLRKWDSASLSSGVSSGDLSSPCDCNDNDDTKIISNGDELCESYYVSQDILEKIRECGSSVTYYGGRVLNNHSTGVSPISKAIMREIHSEDNICGVCQPHNCPHSSKLFTSFCNADNSSHLGVKLRLVKSNSCASRLELTGTHLDENQFNRNNSVSNLENEESVRTIIRRIESNSFNSNKVPRIIESRCIEKSNDPKSKHIQFQFGKDANSILANQLKGDRLGPLQILSQVSVNNHINNINAATANANDKPLKSNIIPRNKNVDLALELSKNPGQGKNLVIKMSKDKTNGLSENDDKIANPPKTKLIDKDGMQSIMDDLNATIAKAHENHIASGKANHQIPKLVKWDTITAYDEKNYIANDVSLKQKPKYDEIEFESYEVIEPGT